MKKIIVSLLVFIIYIPLIYASSKIEVTLYKCVDGDTAWFLINGEKTKVRFLAIDTPESTNTIEAYGKEASRYTCDLLTKAKKIEIEYDEAANKTDKYGRNLAWIFVDGKLLQEQIVESGYAEVAYLYGNYKYTNKLNTAQKKAKENKIGIWSNNPSSSTNNKTSDYLYIGIILLIIICTFHKKTRKKFIHKVKNSIKKAYKKNL